MAIITFSPTCEAIFRIFSQAPTPITHAPIDRMEDVVGTDGHKRARVEGHKDNHKEDSKASGSSSTPARDMKEILGNLPSTVGQGEHQRPIIEALAIGIRDLSMDVQDMKSVITHSWEFPPDTSYVDQGMKFKDQYSRDCRAAKGTGKDLGHQKNYIFLGIYVAYRADKDNSPESKDFMENHLGTLLRNSDGRLDVARAKEISKYISFCQVVRTKKKGFINLAIREVDQGPRILQELMTAMDRAGKRQWDPAPGRPVVRDIKDAITKNRR